MPINKQCLHCQLFLPPLTYRNTRNAQETVCTPLTAQFQCCFVQLSQDVSYSRYPLQPNNFIKYCMVRALLKLCVTKTL